MEDWGRENRMICEGRERGEGGGKTGGGEDARDGGLGKGELEDDT